MPLAALILLAQFPQDGFVLGHLVGCISLIYVRAPLYTPATPCAHVPAIQPVSGYPAPNDQVATAISLDIS